MAEFRISVGIDNIHAAQRMVAGLMFPTVSTGVRMIADKVQENWAKAVHDAKLWSGEKTPYMASIKWEMTGPLSAVVWSDYKYADEIETGRPAKDLKRMLDTSHKVRRTQDGRRFLIIPFRHKVADMPASVYEEARQLAPSRVVGQGQRRAGELTSAAMGIGMVALSETRQRRSPYLSNPQTRSPVMVPRSIYQWGDRLGAGMLGPNQRGKTDRYAGMYRFDTSTPKSKRSSYMTFRVMMEGSPGWVVPARPGLYLARNVATEMAPKAEAIVLEAVRRDLGA